MSPATDDHAHLFGSSDHADSAGQPWRGRRFEANQAASDDGSADAALAAALTSFAEGHGTQSAVIEAFRGARMLVPLLAHAGDVGETSDGHLVDKSQELSITTVSAPDGRAVLPAFTSVQTLTAWNPGARPVPAAGPRVALAAASEQTQLIVIDPTSAGEFVMRRPAVMALATGGSWRPPWDDDDVAASFRESIADQEAALEVTLAAGDPTARLAGPELEVGLVLRPGLEADAVGEHVRRLSARWSQSQVIAERVDSMTLRLLHP